MVMNEQAVQPLLASLLGNRRIVLGSSSPRRVELLTLLVGKVEVRVPVVEEVYPPNMPVNRVPEYLSALKAESLRPTLTDNEVLITADTVVILNGKLIGKPANMQEAKATLQALSGATHQVVSGYTIANKECMVCGSAESRVTFATLQEDEVDYYLRTFSPLDKAGAYGVQEWIGLVGVTHIEGSYHNIMGLPTALLYNKLKQFLQG